MTGTAALKYKKVPGSDTWTKGTIGEFTFCIKHFNTGSRFGIDSGRISKLEIRKGYKILAHYDRGWDVEPTGDVCEIYDAILREFN